MSLTADHKPDQGARRIVLICLGVVVLMVGLSYAAVPLYDLFCRVTGYGGTTNRAAEQSTVITGRPMTIRFDANTARGMAWNFEPVQRSVDIQVGENGLAFYKAVNPTSRTIKGTATFNVTPQKAGRYFTKIDCFCFTEQVLAPGESMDMPVSFYVDPAIEDDPNLSDVNTITLSYTFFETKD